MDGLAGSQGWEGAVLVQAFCFVVFCSDGQTSRRRLTDWYTWLVQLVLANCFWLGRIYFQPLVPVLGDISAPCARQTPDFLSIIFLLLTHCWSTLQQSTWTSFVPINTTCGKFEMLGLLGVEVVLATSDYARSSSSKADDLATVSRALVLVG